MNLISLLQKLGDAEHDDLSVAHDAITEIVRLRLSIQELREERDALLEALQDLCDTLGECGMTEKARAAIAKAEGEKE